MQATSKGSDQTGRMHRLIWGFAGRTYHIVGNLMPRLIYLLYSKTCVKQPLENRQNKDLNDKWQPNEGQKYWSILQYFWPALSYNWSWKPIFGLFESSRFTQVLLFCQVLWSKVCENLCFVCCLIVVDMCVKNPTRGFQHR